MATNLRSDCHRPGAIIPQDYTYVMSYTMPSGCYRGVNIDALNAYQETHTAAVTGRVVRPGKCSVCGAHYIHGDVWFHIPSERYIHIGHDCADKYSLAANRADWTAALEMSRRAAKAELTRQRNATSREEYLATHPGLGEALKHKHRITEDIAIRFDEYGFLSDKQIALVFKIFNESKRVRTEEKHVPAPTGRIAFTGRIVSIKAHDGDFGSSLKVTIKVETPEGSWLAWGTLPTTIQGEIQTLGHSAEAVVGALIELTGTLSAGRDPYFAFFKRPSKAILKMFACPCCKGAIKEWDGKSDKFDSLRVHLDAHMDEGALVDQNFLMDLDLAEAKKV